MNHDFVDKLMGKLTTLQALVNDQFLMSRQSIGGLINEEIKNNQANQVKPNSGAKGSFIEYTANEPINKQ